MLLQKTFHTHQDLAETKVRLASFNGIADGFGRMDFVIGHGFRASLDLVRLPTDDANQLLFRSEAGNVEISGLVEFVPVRDHLTEIQLTIEYTIKSPVHRMLAAMTGSMDRFVVRQIRLIEAHCAGGRGTETVRTSRPALMFSPEAQLAH